MSMRKAKEEADARGVAPSVVGLWKFSKNTQAWLLRHLFAEDQVTAASVSVLNALLVAGAVLQAAAVIGVQTL